MAEAVFVMYFFLMECALKFSSGGFQEKRGFLYVYAITSLSEWVLINYFRLLLWQ